LAGWILRALRAFLFADFVEVDLVTRALELRLPLQAPRWVLRSALRCGTAGRDDHDSGKIGPTAQVAN
jgi:hypothetical protein